MSASNPGRKPAPGDNPKAAANKKKVLILLGLVAGGLLLWGRLLMQQVPRTVVAVPQNEASANAGSGTATPSPEGEGAVATMAASNKPAFREAVKIDIPTRLPRDLFALDPTGYARVPNEQPDIRPPEKSPDKSTDDNQAASDFANAARGLVLQTTILGDQPRAMISGQVLRPGQTIKGFVLRKVLPRQVVLERDGVELKLKM